MLSDIKASCCMYEIIGRGKTSMGSIFVVSKPGFGL